MFLVIRAADTFVLPRVALAHELLVSRTSPSLPEAPSLPAYDRPPAELAGVDAVVLLSRAPAADHPVGPLVDVLLGRVVASVARIHLGAAREAEPAVGSPVVGADATLRQLLPGTDPEVLLLATRSRGGGEHGGGSHAHELHLGYLEGEPRVALSARVRYRVALHGRQLAGCRGAVGAGWDEGTARWKD